MKNMRKELKNYVLSLGIEKSIQSKFIKIRSKRPKNKSTADRNLDFIQKNI